MKTVNHTGYLALAGRPITFSIETKREDMDMDAAVLQIGTWCAAQWKMLRLLLEDMHGEEGAQIALRELAFLPAIFVHGHDWSFAATTLEGRKAVSLDAPDGPERELSLIRLALHRFYGLRCPLVQPLSSRASTLSPRLSSISDAGRLKPTGPGTRRTSWTGYNEMDWACFIELGGLLCRFLSLMRIIS